MGPVRDYAPHLIMQRHSFSNVPCCARRKLYKFCVPNTEAVGVVTSSPRSFILSVTMPLFCKSCVENIILSGSCASMLCSLGHDNRSVLRLPNCRRDHWCCIILALSVPLYSMKHSRKSFQPCS